MDWGEGEKKDNSWDLCFQILRRKLLHKFDGKQNGVCTDKREGGKFDVNENAGIHLHSRTKL